MNNNGVADKQQQSMTVDNGGCLDRTTVEDQLRRGGGRSTMVRQRRIKYIGCGGGGSGGTVVRRQKRSCLAIRSSRMEVDDGRGSVHSVSWQGGDKFLNPTLSPTSTKPAQNLGYFFHFGGGGGLGRIEGRISIGVILWSFFVILTQILPRFCHKSYLKIS
jgi:hypothetical protein